MIKACVFDAFGTLFNLELPVLKLEEAIGEKHVEILSLWRQKQLEYTWLRTLMKRYVPFEQVTEDALKYAFSHHGIENQPLFEELMQSYWKPTLYPDVTATLEQLKKAGLQVAILSNGSPDLLKSGLKHTKLTKLVDQVVSAHTVSKFKVAPPVYQLVEDTLDLYPEELTFQSSNGWDIAGATAYGFTTVWVNRDQKIPDNLGIEADHEIDDLEELPDILKKIGN